MRSRTGSDSQISRLASAAAQAIGLAVKELEWKKVRRRSVGVMGGENLRAAERHRQRQ